MLDKARNRFNAKKKGNGRVGSKFRACSDIWNKAGEVYFNGTHSDYLSLSIYRRPSGRNNQCMEGGHIGSINLGISDENNSSKGSFLRWINTSKKEEIGFENRLFQIKVLNSEPKTKQKKSSIQKDAAITKIISQHGRGEITHRQLLDKYINLTSEHALLRQLRHIDYLLQ